ncbi:MAG: hypothetical protein NTU43_06155 [Bacteroidetes bacterium]|nr:hypothetical protein [Bacteroidota bacterium]
MKIRILILLTATWMIFHSTSSCAQWNKQQLNIDFYSDSIEIPVDHSLFIEFNKPLSDANIKDFYSSVNASQYVETVQSLLKYKQNHNLNDWFYYQLVRKVVQQISPKDDNYYRYTLYKWFVMAKSGYDVHLAIGGQQLLFYIRSDENIYDIPFYVKNNKQYVCLNRHDYIKTDFEKLTVLEVEIAIAKAVNAFSYKISQLPDFKSNTYAEKDIHFDYHENAYEFKIKINPQLNTIFANYPVVDFDSYFNIPLSKETYSSLILTLKSNLQGMSQKEGVEYLMDFTRYAFSYESDQDNYGKEKRLSPELTLLSDHSDCDDRVGLFFYLVKEIYNLPMITLLYPTHVTSLSIGQISSELRKIPYQVVYEYNPNK